MKEYPYTIEEMKQIISEYMEIEDIEIITEEEITDIFGTTFFDLNIYDNVHYFCQYDRYMYISDYEQYLIDNGYDPFFGEYIEDLEQSFVVPWIELYESLDVREDISDMY
ncbi:MAG: hypothetical protein JXB49_29740 [Bacteroidales bacterium]|nr:hypothetical protein [Bacteroidales bacterium]